MIARIYLLGTILLLPITSTANEDANSFEVNPKKVAASITNQLFPESIKLAYYTGEDDTPNSWAIEYNYDSKTKRKLKTSKKGNTIDFGESNFNFFAKGAYAFEEKANTKNLSTIGANYSKRWFEVKSTSKELTPEESIEVQTCVASDDTGESTPATCRLKHGYGGITQEAIYFDFDGHFKVEGNQDYSDRNYVYGFNFITTGMLAKDSFLHYLNVLEYPGRLLRGGKDANFMLPIFTLGLEQVDPTDNDQRKSLAENKVGDVFERIYLELSHTSKLGEIKGMPVKASYSFRYFKEIDAPQVVKNSGQDDFQFYTIALLLPTEIIPNYSDSNSTFTLSYSSGELPFSRQKEQMFELGWQTNVDFGDMFYP